jgi:hypothetical protein
MVRDIKSDLIAHLREYIDETVVDVPFDAGDPSDPTAEGDVRFADYDGSNDYPQVAIVSEDAVVPGGGQTQYSAMDAGGSGGIQDIVTSVQIDCWGGPHDDDVYQEHGSHPDVVANALGRAVHDVLFNSDESSEGPPVPDGYEWLNAEPPTESNDTERTPTHYRRVVVARLKYTKRP